ncbi:PEBP-like protein [Colletotrichum zoysiae]|uniref:PEBP-like protein n=1 Tax=Colletotrichum zoysiae TaxID=1216348 RepID=A0AAD9HLB4_9PEZI|nr:PEBP-like protein [Colletotrichum zoysiae]
MTDVTKIFEEHNLIPDVLPVGTKIPYNLGVHWPTVSLRAPAERLHRDRVQEQPKVTTNFKPDGASGDKYLLLMVDPDLTRYKDGTFGQVRHWLVANARLAGGDVLVDTNDDGGAVAVSPYVGPAPLAAHLIGVGARPSRYTFLLLRHVGGPPPPPAAGAPDAATLRGEYAGDAGALGGDAQHIVDRMGFNARAFIEANGLEVVAATFMFVEGNVKSSLKNAALLVSGSVQKAVGL